MPIWSFLAIQIVLLLIVGGLGRLVLSRDSMTGREELVPLAGLSLLFVILPTIHLIVPMQSPVLAMLAGLSLIGWIRVATCRADWWDLGRRAGVFLVVAITLAWPLSMAMALHYDWGLYYQQVQKWSAACPVVPGLGNVHGRFAFPGTSFLAAGLLDAVFGSFWGARMLGANVLLVTVSALVLGIARAFRTKDRFLQGYGLAGLALLGTVLVGANVTVAAPDILSASLMLVLGLLVARILRGDEHAGAWILPMLAGLVILKLSNAVFAVGTLALLYWKNGWRPRLGGMLLWGTLGAGWMTHNWVVSGWPLYPFGPSLPLGDWVMDPTRVHQVASAIRGWAREMSSHYMETLEGRPWLQGWSIRTSADPSLRLSLIFLAVAVPGLLIRYARRRDRLPMEWWALLPCLLALVAWFFTAPDIRFAWGSLWCLAALMVGSFCEGVRSHRMRSVLLVLLGGCVLPALLRVGGMPIMPLQPKVKLRKISLPSGMIVWAPLDPQKDQVWNAPLPATPEFADIEPRGASLCDGFRVRQPSAKTPTP